MSRGSGALCHVSYSLNSELPTLLVVAGTQGTLACHPFRETWSLSFDPTGLRDLRRTLPQWKDALLRKVRGRPDPRARLRASSHYRQIRAFVEHLQGKGPLPVSGEQAREVVRLWADAVKALGDPAP